MSDQDIQEMIRQAQAGNISKQSQALPGSPPPMPGATPTQIPGQQQPGMPQGAIPGGPMPVAAGAVGINDVGGQQAMLQRIAAQAAAQQGQGYATGGNVAPQDSDLFQNNTRSLVKAAMAKPTEEDEEDGLTGDEMENLARGGSMQGQAIPGYDCGGAVENPKAQGYADGGTTEAAATEDKQEGGYGKTPKGHFLRKLAGFSDGGETDFRGGGMIPGQAPFPGDSDMNDIVKASLGGGKQIRMSPGEEVIPRSIMGKTNAPELAAAMVSKDMKVKAPKIPRL